MATSTGEFKKGDLILVTGATGLIGASVVNDLLDRGLRVRGTTRKINKDTELFSQKIEKLYGPGRLEWVELSNGEEPDAFTSHLKGVTGIVHLAIELGDVFSAEPNLDLAVGKANGMILGVAKAATRFPEIKSLVITSSIVAVYMLQYEDVDVNLKEYNDLAVKYARELPIDNPMKGGATYAATKVLSEKALWEWVDENKPHFRVNAVLPHLVLGKPFNPADREYSTSSWIKWISQGKFDNPGMSFLTPSPWFVNVRDVAALHDAALLDPETNHKRLWAAAEPPKTVNEFFAIWRKAYPDRTFPEDMEVKEPPKTVLHKEDADALLEKYTGRSYVSFEQTIIDNIA